MDWTNTFVQDIWSLENFPQNYYRSGKKDLFFIAAQEYELPYAMTIKDDPLNLDNINSHIEKINANVNMIFGGANKEWYDSNKNSYPKNSKIFTFPNYLIFYTLNSFLTSNINIDIKNQFPKAPSNLYVSLNNRPKYHRLLLINELYCRDMLDESLISWMNAEPHLPDHLFDGKKIKWPVKQVFFQKEVSNYWDLPDKFYDTFISLVGETTIEPIVVTEKAWMNIFLKRPFLSLAAPNYHKYLKGLGIELYDEIFDYSFDSEPDLDRRTQLIVDNLERIKTEDYTKLQTLIKPKLIHNYNQSLRIMLDLSAWPDVLIDFCENHDNHRFSEFYKLAVNPDVFLNQYLYEKN